MSEIEAMINRVREIEAREVLAAFNATWLAGYAAAKEQAAKVARKWGDDQVAKWSDDPEMLNDAKARAWDAVVLSNAIKGMQPAQEKGPPGLDPAGQVGEEASPGSGAASSHLD